MTDVIPTTEESQIGDEGHYDVVVVGAGNAGFSAAHAARELGASVLLLEKAPVEDAGGNSFYTAGAYRIAFNDISDLVPLLDDETVKRLPQTVVPAYPAVDFTSDMSRITEGRNDATLTEILVSRSYDTLRWLHSKGLQFRLMYERQSYEDNGVFTFYGNLVVGSVGGGKGLIAQHTEAAVSSGVSFRYGARVTGLLRGDNGEVTGVQYTDADGTARTVSAGAVVLAAGGFESDPERRERYLGEGWSNALVRGNPGNTGEVLDMALEAGVQRFGDWGSCHSVAWDAGGPANGGNRELTNQMTRQSYPLGIVVNREGKRFVDEGADYRNYTYARYGREILKQPEGIAFQIFDAKTRPMLRTEEYDSTPISGAQADSIEELAEKLGIAVDDFRRTVDEFNNSIVDQPFHPSIKDGRAAEVEPPKSNWALAIDTAPFYGYAVTCGITFTFGGLKVNENAQAVDESGTPIPGLYAAGEMVGGLFSGNYPGGSGLTSGAVFGRLAGSHAASHTRAGLLVS
ncbi:FAD-dependent tricarballylate dehydrogenase TcuA [Arthrobacter methylotrophus]|uniref:FAD-dependent tricarballylate dehydrogenase TcuA n=1 Tax=Arthrobacter methylotrophus TaxID=121291 RepID=A0ABV5UKP9_9MICC